MVVVALGLVTALALTQAARKPNPYPEGDHPLARADWFMRFRQSRDALSPAAHRFQAYERALRFPVLHPEPLRRQLESIGASGPSSLSGNWSELGPRPETDPNYGDVAGRLTAIAVDTGKDPSGNTLYLGAADGGLWMSTDALLPDPTFTPIGDNLPSLAIGSIALDDSTSPTTIYVGTGEPNLSQDSYYGDGIFKSIDGGQTWTQGTGVNFLGSAISRLLIDPTDPQVLLAAVTEGGVYVNNDFVVSAPAIGIVRSADGGATWTQVFPAAGGTAASGTDILYDPANGSYYAALRGQGFFSSSDQGQSWTALPSPFSVPTSSQNFYRTSLALRGTTLFALITDSDGKQTGSYDCSGCSGLVESTNAGQSWRPLSLPAPPNLYGSNSQGSYDQFIAAPPNSNQLVIGGIDVWSGTAGSSRMNWTNLTRAYTGGYVHPDEHAIWCLSATSWVIANDGGAWYTSNAGLSWTNKNATLGTIQFYSVSTDAAMNGAVLGGSQDNGTALLSSGSETIWSSLLGGDGGHTAVNPGQTGQFFTEDYGISLQRSDNSGLTWNPVVNGSTITDIGEFYIPFILAPSDPSTVYLLTQRVWRGPADPGAPGSGWNPISSDIIHLVGAMDDSQDDLTALAAAPQAPNVLYVGAYDGSLSVSQDATNTLAMPSWTEVQPGAATFAGPVGAIAVSPVSPQIVYWGLGFVGPNAALFKSTDGGATAINISGNLPGTPINAIVIDPDAPNDIYVATDVGVFVTTDGGVAGEQWSLLGDNLPAAAVLSLALTRTQDASPVVTAGTHGRGAWSIPTLAPAGFSFAANPALPVVAPGIDAATIILTPTFADGFAGPVTWSCSSTAAVQCGFSPANSAPGGGDTTLTVSGLSALAASSNIPLTVTATGAASTWSEQLALANNGDFNLTALPASVTLTSADNNQAPVTLRFGVSYGLQLNATLSCAGLPAGYTCQVPSGPVAISNGSTTTLTIAAGGAAASVPVVGGNGPVLWLFLLAAASLTAVGARAQRRMPVWAALVLLALASAACGGSSSNNGPPAQTSTVTITATVAPPGSTQTLSQTATVQVITN